MRIGLLIYGRLDQHSGGYLYDRMLVQHLRRRGHQVQVISLPWRGYWRHLTDNFSSQLEHKLGRLQIDILLQDELNHPSLFFLNRRLRNRVSYPFVSIIHLLRSSEEHSPFTAWIYRLVERRYLDSADAFIFNSRDSRRRVQAMIGKTTPSVVATPGGDRLQPHLTIAQVRARAKRKPLQILFLGSLIRRKAPELLLDAARALGRNVHIHFAGRTDMEPDTVRHLRAAAKTMPITFHGHIDSAKLSALMSRCHLMVLPSSYEGFGIAYLEAMGFGLPAIGTRAGAASEVIHPGQNGFLIEPDNEAELTSVLQKLVSDRRLLVRLSLGALSTYKKQATWQESMQRIEDFLSRYNPTSSRTRLRRRNT